MATATARVFDDRPAVRGPTPLLFGIAGPSASGKTFSMLRLATGIQRVIGGDIYVIDTEADRALHYAETFKFRHVSFRAPFGPLDYLAAIEHCIKKGARIIGVDSMSHEHEGPGGVLEMHAAEVDRLLHAWKNSTVDKVNIPAWNKPKSERRRLLNSIIQMDANFIFCFRAKEKVKIQTGKDVKNLGFMPIAGEEFVYELTAKCLLMPGANGIPTLDPEHDGERMMTKIPEHFRKIFAGADKKPLDEDLGAALAKWAAGDAKRDVTPLDEDLVAAYAHCFDFAKLEELETRRKAIWSKLSPADKATLKSASATAHERVAAATAQDDKAGDELALGTE